jgi:hypothetical protein
MSAASAPGFTPGLGVDAASTSKDLEAGRAAIAAREDDCIQVVPDTEGMATHPNGPKRRIAKVKCPECGAGCDIHQAQDSASGEFSPDPTAKLTLFGWQTDGQRLFCGKTCMARYAHKMAQHGGQPRPGVTRITDKGIAKSLYQKPRDDGAITPAAAPSVDVPAAAVVASKMPQRGAPQPQHQPRR